MCPPPFTWPAAVIVLACVLGPFALMLGLAWLLRDRPVASRDAVTKAKEATREAST